MLYQLFLLGLFFSQFTIVTSSLFAQNHSLVNVDLYQCDTNETISNHTVILTNTTLYSCNFTCCGQRNQTSNRNALIIMSNVNLFILDVCQVTTLSSTGACFGRLCYSGDCSNLIDGTLSQNTRNTSAILNKIRSSISSLSWPTLPNSTRAKWIQWKDRNTSSIRSSILIMLLITNISLTLLTLFVIVRSVKYARYIAKKKARRYSLF